MHILVAHGPLLPCQLADHLTANKVKYGLEQENAVDLNSLVRVHE